MDPVRAEEKGCKGISDGFGTLCPVPAVLSPPYLAAPAPRRWKCLRGNAVCGDRGRELWGHGEREKDRGGGMEARDGGAGAGGVWHWGHCSAHRDAGGTGGVQG